MSECVLKMLACRGLRVGPSKSQRQDLSGSEKGSFGKGVFSEKSIF